MFVYGAELVAIACFIYALQRLEVSSAARKGIQAGLETSRVLRDAVASDDDKERAARAATGVLLRSFVSIAMRSAVALIASFLVLVLFHVTGLASISAVNQLMLSTNGILFAFGITALIYVAKVLL